MSNVVQNTASPPTQTNTRIVGYLVTILALLIAVLVGLFEFGLLVKLRSDRDVLQSVIAGTTRAEIESKYGAPRFRSQPGRPLADAKWNGGEKDTISEFGMSVYDTSIFEFIICEFDEQDRLVRAWVWIK